MVLQVGFEPTRPCGHRILSPKRLPVPPLEQISLVLPDGFEPTPVRGLSSMPLPRLGYGSKLLSYSNVSDISLIT